MALRSLMKPKLPVVIIVGPTGVGKTKLSLSMAQKFNTEVIGADSMQIYKSLDIVTAKATLEERALVPHHLLDILEPHQCFTVVDFRSRALKIIDNMLQQDKLPLVVGGTNYYIESIVYQILVECMDDPEELLWDRSRKRIFESDDVDKGPGDSKRIAKDTSHADDKTDDKIASSESKDTTPIEQTDSSKDKDPSKEDAEISQEELNEFIENETKYTNEELHAKLKAVDPVMADRLHPNNRRKVVRAIEIYVKSGRRQSELLAEQKAKEGQLRWPGATIMLWLTCEQKVHDARLDARVDQMLQEGLIQELLDFHDKHNKQRILHGQPADYTKGIFQTMGFKEFHEYLMLSPEAKESESGKKLLAVSIDNMKLATRRYARRQMKMVRTRFLTHPNRQVPPVYQLDTTDLTKWEEQVEKKAFNIVESHINGVPSDCQPVKVEITDEQRNDDVNSRHYCDVCERIILGDRTYKIHLESIKHGKVLKKKQALAKAAKSK